ncbi:probable ubiquitin-conjugating enzyme E2 25 isoform X1 [Lycium ferocissimum]|uniref:probable ubiquitin-conjugating enzyme E2 25 isoform X1 n=2 Tax=Lycium ferocissimum TaxID=112874 RepID=UPI0028169E82|nr:probable ubiquitin-conjugating enzyme E2 25 isoform X1 [Lycium ferocissimum]
MMLMHRKIVFFHQNSEERVFPGGSSINAQVDEVSPSISWIPISESAKQKEPIHHGVIDVNMEGSDNDLMLIDGNTESNGKGKEIFLELSLGRGPSQVQSSKKHSSSESDEMHTDVFYEDDVPTDMNVDDLAHNYHAFLQSHFDHMDIPPGVEVPIPWMFGPAEAKMAPTTTSSSSTSKPPSLPSWLTPVSQPTPFELPSSSLGPTFCKSQLSAIEQSGSKNLSLGGEKIFNAQGSHLKRKFHSDGWHTQSIPGASHFPTVHFVPPPPMPSWMSLPLNMTTPQASSGFMNPLPLKQVHPGFMLAPGDMNSLPLEPVHPGYILTPDPMNYFPQEQLSSGSVLAPGAMYYFSQEMDHHAVWTQGPKNIETTTDSPSFQCKDLGESLKNFRLFKKFDTVQDHSDHYFSKLASPDQASKSCAKRIQAEWKILEKDLPDTIFVRVYETRMDLLRAVIIGADGTPYHDGLFFFDVFFPSTYPHVPPHVHYHSFGLRINPNLYDCGKVCLSLLNTWGGRGKEKWIPGGSTMLQVLVSIQGLILNAKPYFNEPGYAKLSGSPIGEQSSLHYNENTYIDNLKTMVYCMRRPPQHFEDFVVGHYFQSCQDILAACKAYMDGARVGSLVRGCVLDQNGDEGGDKSCSQHFKAMLAGFIPTLIDTFTKIGAKDCDKFLPLAEKASTGVEQVKIESC